MHVSPKQKKNNRKISDRQESVIASRLLIPQDYVKKLCTALKKDHLIKDKGFKLRTTQK